MRKLHWSGLLGVAVILGAVLNATSRKPATQQATLSIQLLDTAGARYNGAAAVLLSQDLQLPTGEHRNLVWGPVPMQFSSGAGSAALVLQSLESASEVEIDVFPADETGATWESRAFFLDPSQGARATASVLPGVLPNGDIAISIRRLQVVRAPLYGTIQLPAVAPQSANLAVHCAARFDERLLSPSSGDPLSAPWVSGGSVPLYHWGVGSSVDVRLISESGSDSGPMRLLRGGSLTAVLYSTGSVAVSVPEQVAVGNPDVVLFPSAEYVPLQFPAGVTDNEACAAAFMRLLSGKALGRSPGAAEYLLTELPVGQYTLEVWRESDLLPPTAVLPSPYFSCGVVVSSGGTASVVVP